VRENEILLPTLVLLPAGAAAILAAGPPELGRRALGFAAAVSSIVLGFALWTFLSFDPAQGEPAFVFDRPWFSVGGIEARLRFAVDGLSILLLPLTALLSLVVFLCAPSHVLERRRGFAVLGLLMETGMLGVFAAADVVLFYFFWEVSLLPLYFLIGMWGGPRREIATVKFVLYTLAGSFVLLVALLALVLETETTDLHALARASLPRGLETWAFLGFAVGFAVKVPLFPFHTWLPDAHVEAPTSGSVVLAGVLLKMGTYGLLRVCLPIFPHASVEYGGVLLALGAAGVVYGSLLAWAQRDLKKLVACSSIAHLGLVVVGLFALDADAARGALLQMVNHGITTGALFLLVGVLYDRTHRRGLDDFGGIAGRMPVFATLFLLVALASVGLPGLNGFVGEFLVLEGTMRTAWPWAAAGTAGVVLSAVYLLGAARRVLFGPPRERPPAETAPLTRGELASLLPLAALAVVLGLFPKPLLDRVGPAVDRALARPLHVAAAARASGALASESESR
jgi:NADH-quinone oxidoreductase subunit M